MFFWIRSGVLCLLQDQALLSRFKCLVLQSLAERGKPRDSNSALAAQHGERRLRLPKCSRPLQSSCAGKLVTDCQKGLKQLSARLSVLSRGWQSALFGIIMTQICMCMSSIIHVAACLAVGTDVSEISDSRSR